MLEDVPVIKARCTIHIFFTYLQQLHKAITQNPYYSLFMIVASLNKPLYECISVIDNLYCMCMYTRQCMNRLTQYCG